MASKSDPVQKDMHKTFNAGSLHAAVAKLFGRRYTKEQLQELDRAGASIDDNPSLPLPPPAPPVDQKPPR